MRIIVLLLIAALSGNLHAIKLSCDKVNEEINRKILALVKDTYAQVDFVNLSVKSMGTALPTNCDYISFNFPKKTDLSGDIVIKFDAFKNDHFQKRATKVFRVSGFATILRATQISHRGDIVHAGSTYPQKIKVNKVTPHTVSKIKEGGVQFRNYVDKDQIIEAWMVEKKPDVLKGELISAIVKKEKITLTLDARILENGHIGDSVKLKLKKNNKVLLGTLHDKKTVIISSL